MKKSKLFPGTNISKNPGLFFVEYWKRDPSGWELDHMRSGGSMKWAELCAKSLLKPIYPTKYTYWEDLRKADHCVVYKADGTGRRITINPETIIVPSVGELGYW